MIDDLLEEELAEQIQFRRNRSKADRSMGQQLQKIQEQLMQLTRMLEPRQGSKRGPQLVMRVLFAELW